MNEEKCHLLIFGSKHDEVTVSISGSLIQESDEEKRIRMTLDKTLSFKTNVSSLCKKASQKLHALVRVHMSECVMTGNRIRLPRDF